MVQRAEVLEQGPVPFDPVLGIPFQEVDVRARADQVIAEANLDAVVYGHRDDERRHSCRNARDGKHGDHRERALSTLGLEVALRDV